MRLRKQARTPKPRAPKAVKPRKRQAPSLPRMCRGTMRGDGQVSDAVPLRTVGTFSIFSTRAVPLLWI
ncbi:MAG: hypothetical protein WCE24_07160, partial [Pseudolabrys sp.]